MSTVGSSNNLLDLSLDIPDIVCEFFEVIIHNILFVRKLYPEGIFVKCKKYGVIVNKSVHPHLNEYISQSLKAVRFHFKAKQLKRLFICFMNDEKLVERYVFEILKIEDTLKKDPYVIKLEECFRSLYLKLITSVNYLNPLPVNTNFTIQLHTTEYSNIEFNENPSNEDFPWIQVSAQSSYSKSAEIVPVQTFTFQTAVIQFYIESFIQKI